MSRLVSFMQDEMGASAVEYGLIAGSISLVLVGAVALLGGDSAIWFQKLMEGL